MKTIEKSIEINAPKEKVWELLVNNDLNRAWYAEFNEGIFAETDWKIGSKVVFADRSGNGLIGKISENEPCKVLSVAYTGILSKGVEITTVEEVNKLQGGYEKYCLIEQGNVVRLDIAGDMQEEYFESMSVSWEKALHKLKELAVQ